MTDVLQIRHARRGDLQACVDLLAEDVLGTGRELPEAPLDERYVAAFQAIESNPDSHLLIGEIGGRIVALAQLMLLPHLAQIGTLRAQIEGVRVAASLRGQGLGAQLMMECVERARTAGAEVVQLTTNSVRDDAKRFYERLGFEASHVGMKLPIEPR